jgi:hypothetical protein
MYIYAGPSTVEGQGAVTPVKTDRLSVSILGGMLCYVFIGY